MTAFAYDGHTFTDISPCAILLSSGYSRPPACPPASNRIVAISGWLLLGDTGNSQAIVDG